MALIEVIYEHGVLRPLRPLDLAEGTRLEVTMTAIAPLPPSRKRPALTKLPTWPS
jgi:predicted DNA-binding antitoxin AbrB/MazE fold protein